ncbi:hypothetical protein DMI65_21815 [Escherichia coli]|nr:hypothetical protein [Escherichia coli]
MSNEDLLAAANTARAAGNGAARDRWLQQAEQRGTGKQCPLLVATCATLHSGQPELALNDLTRSINIAPSLPTLTPEGQQFIANVIISRRR